MVAIVGKYFQEIENSPCGRKVRIHVANIKRFLKIRPLEVYTLNTCLLISEPDRTGSNILVQVKNSLID